MTLPQQLFRNTTNAAEVTGLHDEVADSYPTTATVVVTLYTAAGVAVSGATALSCAYASGTGVNTVYRGEIPHTVALSEKTPYTAVFTATIGSRQWQESVSCYTN